MANFLSLITVISKVSLLKEPPSAIPFSNGLFAVLCLITMGLYWCAGSMLPGLPFGLYLTGSMVVQFCLLYILLRLKQMQNRFIQSASALLATQLFILVTVGIATIVLAKLLPVGLLLSLLLVSLWVWFLAVMGHILRHTLELGWPSGILLAMFFGIATNAIMAMVFPDFMIAKETQWTQQ